MLSNKYIPGIWGPSLQPHVSKYPRVSKYTTHRLLCSLSLSSTYSYIQQCFIAKKGNMSNSVFPLHHSHCDRNSLKWFLQSHVKRTTNRATKGIKMCEIFKIKFRGKSKPLHILTSCVKLSLLGWRLALPWEPTPATQSCYHTTEPSCPI